MPGEIDFSTLEGRNAALATRETRATVRNLILGLMRSEAWKTLSSYLDGEVEKQLALSTTMGTGDEVLRAMGKINAYRAVKVWPAQLVASIDQMNVQEENAEKAQKERDHGSQRPHATR